MTDWFAVNREFLVFGKPESLHPRTIDYPETELVEPGEDEFIHVNRIVPVHPLTEGLSARVMRSLVWRALEKFVAPARDGAAPFPEWHAADQQLTALPATRTFPSRANAVQMVQFPRPWRISRSPGAAWPWTNLWSCRLKSRGAAKNSRPAPVPCPVRATTAS